MEESINLTFFMQWSEALFHTKLLAEFPFIQSFFHWQGTDQFYSRVTALPAAGSPTPGNQRLSLVVSENKHYFLLSQKQFQSQVCVTSQLQTSPQTEDCCNSFQNPPTYLNSTVDRQVSNKHRSSVCSFIRHPFSLLLFWINNTFGDGLRSLFLLLHFVLKQFLVLLFICLLQSILAEKKWPGRL